MQLSHFFTATKTCPGYQRWNDISYVEQSEPLPESRQ